MQTARVKTCMVNQWNYYKEIYAESQVSFWMKKFISKRVKQKPNICSTIYPIQYFQIILYTQWAWRARNLRNSYRSNSMLLTVSEIPVVSWSCSHNLPDFILFVQASISQDKSVFVLEPIFDPLLEMSFAYMENPCWTIEEVSCNCSSRQAHASKSSWGNIGSSKKSCRSTYSLSWTMQGEKKKK